MQINFTGHHIDVTPALRDFTSGKFDHLERFADKITSIHVTFSVENRTKIAEANIAIPGGEVHARSETEDMYSSIDALIDKLERQLMKHKEKDWSGHR